MNTQRVEKKRSIRRKISRLFKEIMKQPDPIPLTTEELKELEIYSVLTSEMSLF